MKIWQKGPSPTTQSGFPPLLEKFTIGNDNAYDMLMAEHDVLGSLAHVKMLAHIGLVSQAELVEMTTGLEGILAEIRQGQFSISEGVEDIHSQVEFLLTQRIGESGKKIHTGRSRNDQVLLDIKLFLRTETKQIANLAFQLFETLQSLSEQHKESLLPGYTHFQMAMPSSFGLWFGAYAESLAEDMEMLATAYQFCNKNPLGSGAGYGSSFPLNREMVSELLGFDELHYNVVNAQMSRGKTEKWVAIAIAALAATLSRFAYDVCLYTSANYGFVSFPDNLTTGSSIMPHKRNPDVFELIRAKCNLLQAIPNEITLLCNNLPSGYHRDMQLTKECLFPALTTLKDCLEVCNFMLGHIGINPNIMNGNEYNVLFSVERVNELVLQGIPFRDAYVMVGNEIANNTVPAQTKLNHSHTGSMGNLANQAIKGMMLKAMERMGIT